MLVTNELGYTAEDEQSQYSRYESASTTTDTDGGRDTLSSGDVPSMTPGHGNHEHTRTGLGDQGVKCARFVAVDEVQNSCFHFPGPEGNEQNEPGMSSLDWNSNKIIPC